MIESLVIHFVTFGDMSSVHGLRVCIKFDCVLCDIMHQLILCDVSCPMAALFKFDMLMMTHIKSVHLFDEIVRLTFTIRFY